MDEEDILRRILNEVSWNNIFSAYNILVSNPVNGYECRKQAEAMAKKYLTDIELMKMKRIK